MSTLGRAAYMAGKRAASNQPKPQVPHSTLGELATAFPLTRMSVVDSAGRVMADGFGRDMGVLDRRILQSGVKSMFPYMLGIEYPAVAFNVTLNGTF